MQAFISFLLSEFDEICTEEGHNGPAQGEFKKMAKSTTKCPNASEHCCPIDQCERAAVAPPPKVTSGERAKCGSKAGAEVLACLNVNSKGTVNE